jgi:DNA-binding PadR family transcriptional regulator
MAYHPAVDYALLSVIRQSGAGIHGYCLIREANRALGGTWFLNQGDVYRGLDRLLADGLVTRVATGVEDRRKPCRITEKGRDALEAYAASPLRRRQRSGRDELAVKLLSARPEQALGFIAMDRRQCEEELQKVAARRPRKALEGTPRMTHLLIDAAEARTRARLAWLRAAERTLRAALPPSRASGRARATPLPPPVAPPLGRAAVVGSLAG